jgi:hypothetical protein
MARELSRWPARVAVLCDDRTPFLHLEWKGDVEPSVKHPADWELIDPVEAASQLPVYDPTPGWHLFDGTLIIIEDDFPPFPIDVGQTDRYYWHYEWEGSWRKPSSAADLRFCQVARKTWYDA